MTSGPQLERSLLETKERDELQMIAQAMELKTSARASKATLIGAILDATGVASEASASTTSTSSSSRPRTTSAPPASTNGDAAPSDDAEHVGVAMAPSDTTAEPSVADGGSSAPLTRGPRPQGGATGQQGQFDPANRRNNRRRRGRDRDQRSDRAMGA